MLTQIVIFMLLSTGSVLGATIVKKRYEEFLPITCSAIVLILFLFGICGNLNAGVYFLCILSVVLYLLSIYIIWEKKCLKEALKNIFTGAFVIFAILFCTLSFLDKGKLMVEWDEFSHWGDIVKVMVTLDDFGTNPDSHSICQAYPPGMSLFQYFVQKIYSICSGKNNFNEWRLYFAYQIFALSFFFPFLKKLNNKNMFGIVSSGFLIFVSPLLFYHDFYSSIYIDPFLGILAGMGLVMIFVHECMDCSYILYELSICTMLVLAKDAGMLFAVTIVVLFWVDTIKREKEQEKGISKNILIICAVFPISVFALKFLWGLNIKMNGANVLFSQPVDFKSLALVLLGRESSYRTEVWRNYCRQLISHKIPIGNTGIEINYITLFVMLVCLLYWLLHKQTGKRIEGIGNKTFIGTIVLLTAVYIIGLCITYMYKFTEYEAKQYASFQRYINILFLAVWILINMLVLELINGSPQKHKMTGMVFICIVAASIPLETIDSFVRRQEIVDSANSRSAYEEISEKIMRESGEEISKVYLISQESSGYDWFVIRYNVRPNYIDNLNGRWSIGKPFYEGDVWTREMTAEQWKEELKNNYDLVALYKVNEYFMQNFAVVFENPNEIEENEVYRVNKQTGLLEKCVD